MQKSFFITSTGTGIGKTIVTCSLIRQLRSVGENVSAVKPLISGWGNDVNSNDTLQILTSLGLPLSEENINKISPWRFIAPLAATMAAKKENKEINYSEVLDFCRKQFGSGNLFIEGAGGVMAPIAERKTCLDLIADLEIPVILVVGSYLGTISHTLTAIRSMDAYGARIHSIIINESENCQIPLEETINELRKFTSYKIYSLKRVAKHEGFIWQYTENLIL